MKIIFRIARVTKTLMLTSSLAWASLLVNAQVAENDFSYNTLGTGFNGAVHASALQGDGKLIVGGSFTSFNGTARNRIARLNTNGTLDTGFDPGSGFDGTVYALAIQPSNGKVIVGGDFTTFNGNTQNVIFRLNTDGSYDNSFATTGTGLDNLIYGLALQADEKIVVGGLFTSYDGTSRNYIARLNTDGSHDTGFDPGTGFGSWVRCVAIQGDGKIIAGGDFTTYDGAGRNYIARVSSAGTLDGTFLPGTTVPGKVYALSIQSDGKILACGSNSGITETTGRLLRLLTTGSNDNGFTQTSQAGLFKSVAIQADGKILLGGKNSKGLLRLSASGVSDTFVGGNGFEGGSLSVNSIIIQSNGSIIAAGDFASFNGSSAGKIARIAVCNSVAISTQPTTSGVCEGNSTSFNIVATGTGLTYKWQLNTAAGVGLYADISNDATYAGVTTATLSLTGVTTGMSTYRYRCLVTDATCTTTSTAAILNVFSVPSITAQPASAIACDGGSTNFSVTTDIGTAYQWQYDDGTGYVNWQFTGATSSTLPVSGITASMDGYKFRCIVGSCSPSIISGEATLTVNLGPTITTQASNASFCNVAGVANFTVESTGAISHQWQKYTSVFSSITDGGIHAGTNTQTLTVTGGDNGSIYRCVLTGSNTCTTISSNTFLYVYGTPTILTHPANANKCEGTGGNVTFSVAVTTPVAGLTYQWQEKVGAGAFTDLINGGTYSGVTNTTLTLASTGVTAAMNGNKYRCVVGTCSIPVISSEADLIVDSKPVITTGPVASTICSGMNTEFSVSATGVGITFQWQQRTSGSGTFVDLTNGGIYSGATSTTLTLTNVTTSETGSQYRCIVTASGVCTAVNTGTALLTVRSLPTFNTQPVNKEVCEGLATTIGTSVNNAFSTYQWQVDAFGIGFVDLAPDANLYPNGVTGASLAINSTLVLNGNKYRLRVGSCLPDVYSNEVTLTVNQTPAFTNQPVDKTVCVGESTTFSVAAIGSAITYRWMANGSPIGDNNPYSGTSTATLTITNIPASLVSGTKYSCQITGATGCTIITSTEATLTINDTKITTQPFATPNTICAGGNATISMVATGPSLTYQWQESTNGSFVNVSNGGIYSGATTSTLTLTGLTGSPKQYQCVVTSTCGSKTSNVATISITNVPKPNISIDNGNPEAPILVVSGASNYQWFKDGIAISGQTGSSYTVTAAGSYTVQGETNSCKSETSDAHVIIITGDITDGHSFNGSILYPNPTSNTLMVYLYKFNKGEEVSITIKDMLGRTVETTQGMGGSKKEINVHAYTSGQYLVTLQQAQQKVQARFIKSN